MKDLPPVLKIVFLTSKKAEKIKYFVCFFSKVEQQYNLILT